jgi:1-acyl-sn-glycerol-3-phosphate acyltransferase
VLKTSSGKIRRAGCRELYEQGRIGRGIRPTWWQVARLWFSSLKPRWRRTLRAARDLAYAAHVYVMFGMMLSIAVFGLLLCPRLQQRLAVLRWSSRWLLKLAGIALVVRGEENLPMQGGCVLVANHASYLDGLIVLSFLPRPVSFVAKAELARSPFSRWFLSRINTQFVERFDAQQGSEDADHLARVGAEGSLLLFFPEGTFTRYPGLLPFHMGAFSTAAANDLDVVPITIRGTRSVLRSNDLFPRRGTVAVMIGESLSANGRDWDAALALRNRARKEILRHLGEPDLSLEHAMPE